MKLQEELSTEEFENRIQKLKQFALVRAEKGEYLLNVNSPRQKFPGIPCKFNPFYVGGPKVSDLKEICDKNHGFIDPDWFTDCHTEFQAIEVADFLRCSVSVIFQNNQAYLCLDWRCGYDGLEFEHELYRVAEEVCTAKEKASKIPKVN